MNIDVSKNIAYLPPPSPKPSLAASLSGSFQSTPSPSPQKRPATVVCLGLVSLDWFFVLLLLFLLFDFHSFIVLTLHGWLSSVLDWWLLIFCSVHFYNPSAPVPAIRRMSERLLQSHLGHKPLDLKLDVHWSTSGRSSYVNKSAFRASEALRKSEGSWVAFFRFIYPI